MDVSKERKAVSAAAPERVCRRRSFLWKAGAQLRKRLPLLAVTAAFLLASTGFAGCAAAQAPTPDDGRLKIVTTIFPPYDFARAIAGEERAADVTMLLKPGQEVHSYEPTPLDIKKIQECDLFLYTGSENDVWVDRILDNMGEERPQTLRLVDLTDTLAEEVVEGMMEERGHDHSHADHAHEAEHTHDEEQDHEAEDAHEAEDVHDEEHEHEAEDAHDEEQDHEEADHAHEEHTHSGDSSEEEHEEADEHVWTSPVKAAEITEAIEETMARLDPANAEVYKKNAEGYIAQILALDAQFRKIADSAERKTIVFGDRFPVRYFAEEYGLNYYAAFPGCASETEPSASTLAFLIDKVRTEKIPVVFSIEFSSGNIARAICESSGAVPRTYLSCHNVTREQMESGATYVSMMTENLDVIREALGDAGTAKER